MRYKRRQTSRYRQLNQFHQLCKVADIIYSTTEELHHINRRVIYTQTLVLKMRSRGESGIS